ncbi:MAG: alpha/beta hydrolase [Pseudomonadota bacterium]|nr:alpha/beta hydrolase [Pseudomonadota bacterium]
MRIEVEPGVRLFVDVEGAGLVPDGASMRVKPTLVLLHGGPGFDHVSFKPLFSSLIDIAQVVYVDHRGHGRSDARPASEWTLDTFADDVVRLCDALGIDQPIVLGQSFGGFVAQRYLARHPAHPSRVILSSTSAGLNLSRKLAMFERLGGAPARAAAEHFWTEPNAATWAAYERLCRPLYNRLPPADPLAAGRGRFVPEILYTWGAREHRRMDLLPGLSRARCPVLVMAGTRDPVCPLDDAADIAAALPDEWVEFATFEGCGHGVWRDDPVAAMTRIRAFIAA